MKEPTGFHLENGNLGDAENGPKKKRNFLQGRHGMNFFRFAPEKFPYSRMIFGSSVVKEDYGRHQIIGRVLRTARRLTW